MNKNPRAVMPVSAHLNELKNRFIVCIICFAAFSILGWFLSDKILDALRKPILDISESTGRLAQINYSDITSAFNIKLETSLIAGLIISAPIVLYNLWRFFMPALYKKERKTALFILFGSVPLFALGCLAGWIAVPNLVKFFLSYASQSDSSFISADEYIKFVLYLMIFMGLGFVMPLIVVILNAVGVMSSKTILKGWRVAIVIALCFASFITPPTDILSMFLVSLPMLILYFMAYIISCIHDAKERKKLNNI